MAFDNTQFVHFEGSTSGLTIAPSGSGSSGQASWTFDGDNRLQVPAGLYYIQLRQTLDYPLSGANNPVLSVIALTDSGDPGNPNATQNRAPVVPGAADASVNATFYADLGITFNGVPGNYSINVVQIAPLA